MTSKLERIRRKARIMFNDAEREPWETAWSRVFEALPDFCEDTDTLRMQMLQAAIDGADVVEVEREMLARVRTVPPCPVPAGPAIPPCPV